MSGENHNVLNLVFSLCMSECLAKLQDTAMSLLYCSLSLHFLPRQPQPVGRSYHFLLQPSGCQHHTKTKTAFLKQRDHLNWYIQHHSLAEG